MLGLSLCICLVIIVIKYIKSNSDYWKKRNVKSVHGLMSKFVMGNRSLSEIFKEVYNAHPNLPYIGTILAMKPALIVRDVDNIRAVLHGDFQSFYARGFTANTTDVLADNLLFAEDYNRWKLIRQRVSPFFTTENLKNMFYITERCARDFTDYIEENPQITENPFNAIYTFISACISSAVFGIDEETRNTMKTPFSEMAYQSLKPSFKLNLKFAISNISPNHNFTFNVVWLPKLLQLLKLKTFGDYEELFVEMMRKVMDKRRRDQKICHDFIDICLKLEDESVMKDFVTGYKTDVTIELLAAQAFVFILAGIDSSANAMHFTLLELSNNPNILQKLHEEIDEVFKNNGGTLVFDDIDKLEYMEKVRNEAIRKYPPIGTIQRRCCKETVLPVGGLKVEKDTTMFIPIYALHRDEKYFPNPDVFDPERFSAENISKIVDYSYMPFGAGKRICIGTRLSRIVMKTGLAWLLRKYTLKEQSYTPDHFEQSFFSVRDPKAYYEIIPRNKIVSLTMFLFLTLIGIVTVLLYFYLRKGNEYWQKRNVVYADNVMFNFLCGNRSLAEVYKELYDHYSDEKYIGIIVGRRPALLLKDVDDIACVLQGDFHNFHSRGIVTNPNDILADNLLFMNDYRRWKLLRQKISPVFTHMKLKNMFYIMERCARDFVEFIEENPKIRSKPFNALYTYTTASTGASVFGIDTQTQNTMDCPFMEMAWKIFEPSFFNNMKFLIANYCPTIFNMLNLKTFGEHEKFFIGVMKKVLESRRNSKEMRHDFIDTCLELQQSGILQDLTTNYTLEPTDEILAAQAFFFFIAGADPSASSMNYALLELSNNPPILKRLHKEIDEVFDNCNGTLTYDDMEKLEYLDMVLNEAMRKYPSIGSIQRTCMKDTILPTGLKVEENTVAFIPVFAMHRDEKLYPNPNLYDPERFASDNVSNIGKYTYLPFGGGNRVCIGLRFARLQMKAGLALLLRRFTVKGQNYQTVHFEPSFFAVRDQKVTYELVLREHCKS
ncbi:uncharacterized protein [Epargyreus clarus]|uniref:uncharacterized protein n=1 Tax=Epargyreus clarus TaxID=520877 RepID=UPI003C2F09FA